MSTSSTSSLIVVGTVSEQLFTVSGLRHTYQSSGRSVPAIEDLSFTVNKGDFVSICGPSGCGKTTVLRILAGLLRPSGGAVSLRGAPVRGPQPDIGVVFQEPSAFPWRSVRKNVEFGLQAKGVSRGKRREVVDEMLGLVGLTDFADSYPQTLSGGMLQRVAIARTLAVRPDIMVMDEPFAALDEQTRLDLGYELLNIVKESGTTVILVTHSIQEAALLSDRIIVLTERPASIKGVLESTLPKPRTIDTLATTEFGQLVQALWGLIRADRDEAALRTADRA